MSPTNDAVFSHRRSDGHGGHMITAGQLRAGRALLVTSVSASWQNWQMYLFRRFERMEASDENVRGVIESLTKVVEAFDRVGVELIGENTPSAGSGRGVRLKRPKSQPNEHDGRQVRKPKKSK